MALFKVFRGESSSLPNQTTDGYAYFTTDDGKFYIDSMNDGDTIASRTCINPEMEGATSSAAGSEGMVPAPSAGDEDKFLKADGTWATVSSGGGNLQNLVDGSSTGSVRGVGSAEEDSSYTIGTYAVSEGQGTIASGNYSHAEGYNTEATGAASHAEGNSSVSSGSCSHAEGWYNDAHGDYSHAEGYYAVASGERSHAEGYGTIASGKSSNVIGEFNIEDPSAYTLTTDTSINSNKIYYTLSNGKFSRVKFPDVANISSYYEYTPSNAEKAFIIGNGTSSARSNALTVDWTGDVDIASGAHYKINGTNLSASDVGAQPTLVSGTNIKTINNESILGSGNITISPGGVTGVKGDLESSYRTGNVNITVANIGAQATINNLSYSNNSYSGGLADEKILLSSTISKWDTILNYNVS